jgi:CheY-like chemotaxis protein
MSDGSGSEEKSLSGKTVLVVEDSPIVQLLAIKQILSLGLEPEAVSNGQEAIDAVRGKSFDLILMDCQMKEIDGFAATQAIRRLEAESNRHTPIVAMTAGVVASDREKCLDAGMDDYICKPFTIQQLREKIIAWLIRKDSPTLPERA